MRQQLETLERQRNELAPGLHLGGRPGEKIRSLTPSRCCSIAEISWSVGTCSVVSVVLIGTCWPINLQRARS
jgi:hypothetical protein